MNRVIRIEKSQFTTAAVFEELIKQLGYTGTASTVTGIIISAADIRFLT